jgi:methionine-rich copper-binding protein CopC
VTSQLQKVKECLVVRKVLIAVVSLFTALFVTMGTASMASAHSDTYQSVPADDATMKTPVTEIQFTFVEPVNAELSPPEVALVNEKGIAVELGAPILDETGATMTAQILTGALPNGVYTASFRIVSQDGHPASGELLFTVEDSTAPALVAATDADTDTDAIAEADADALVTSAGDNANSSQLQLVLGLSAAGAVILAAVLVFVSLRRRRNSAGK